MESPTEEYTNMVEKIAYVASCDAKMISIATEIIENIENLNKTFLDRANTMSRVEIENSDFRLSLVALKEIAKMLQRSIDCLEKNYQDIDFTLSQS